MTEFLRAISYDKWINIKGVMVAAFIENVSFSLPLTAFVLFAQEKINVKEFLDLVSYDMWKDNVQSVQALLPKDYPIHLGTISFKMLSNAGDLKNDI